jgi:branched-subunit amino acid transport protein
MSNWTIWAIILGGMAATYVIRSSFILLWDPQKLPPIVWRGLHYVAPAVLAAFVFPELFRPGGQYDLSLGNFRMLAGLLAAVVAWRTRNAWLTILVGMAALWLLTHFLG